MNDMAGGGPEQPRAIVVGHGEFAEDWCPRSDKSAAWPTSSSCCR